MKTKQPGHLRKPNAGGKKKELVNANHGMPANAETNDSAVHKDTCEGYCATRWKPNAVNGRI